MEPEITFRPVDRDLYEAIECGDKLFELRANYDPADLMPGGKTWDDVWQRVTAFPGYAQRLATDGIIVFEFEPVS